MSQANKHKKNVQYQPGDLVWIHLRKEHFLSKRKSKLMPRSDRPFEILEKIGPNAYKVDLPGEYGVSATFNVADLSPYYDEDEEILSLRSNSSQAGEDDGDHPTKDPKEAEKVKEAQETTKDVNRIQTMVRNLLFQAQDILPNSPGKNPVFVHLLTQAPLGMIDYNLPYPQVQEVSCPIKQVASLLEVIWPVNQAKTSDCAVPGPIQRRAESRCFWATILGPFVLRFYGMEAYLNIYQITWPRLK